MTYIIPVNSFEDPSLIVVKGLKKRFTEGVEEFRNTRVSVLKTEADEPVKPTYEVTVLINGGSEAASGTVRSLGLSVLAFAPDYASANRLAAKTVEYIQSLTALGKIKYVSIEAAGIHVENPGSEQMRHITATIRIKANKTTLYSGE